MRILISEVKRHLRRSKFYYRYFDNKFEKSEQYKNQKNFFSKLIDTESLIFDVGANIGNKAYIFKSLSKRVVLFEPQPFCIDILETRFNGDPSIIIEPIALGNSPGVEKIYLSNHHTLASLSEEFINGVGKKIFPDSNWNKFVNITVSTLDKMILKHGLPDFIKIDVEGYELEVLSGLNYEVPMVSFEFTPNDLNKVEDCLSLLIKINKKYRFNFTLGENLNLQLKESITKEELLKCSELIEANTFGDIYAIST